MTTVVRGGAMPQNLTEALDLDLFMENNWRSSDAAFEARYLANNEAINAGRWPIRSPEEAAALLGKLERDLQHSDGDFVEKIISQVRGYVLRTSAAPMLEAAE